MKKIKYFLFVFIVVLGFKIDLVKAANCLDYYGKQTECINNGCSYNETHSFCSPNGLTYLKCGDAYDIPEIVPTISSYAIVLLKTIAPLILIIVSIIQLVKAIASSKEDDIKKAQGSLIKKIIAAALVFFVVSIVQFVMLKVASDDVEKNNLSDCLSCFLNGKSNCNSFYYKDGYGKCYSVNTNGEISCK